MAEDRVPAEGSGGFVRDEAHWLFKLSPREWLRAGLAELARAEAAYARRDARAGLAGLRRAAGMALNGALIVEPDDAWGRSYVDHLNALVRSASDDRVPARVREAAALLVETPLPGQSKLVTLRLSSANERAIEAAKDLVAHAYAVIRRSEEAT